MARAIQLYMQKTMRREYNVILNYSRKFNSRFSLFLLVTAAETFPSGGPGFEVHLFRFTFIVGIHILEVLAFYLLFCLFLSKHYLN
jgi:hypothetical protein